MILKGFRQVESEWVHQKKKRKYICIKWGGYNQDKQMLISKQPQELSVN
jgi:hypothetical protein